MRLGIAAAASGLVRTGLLMGAVSGIAGCGGRGEIGLMPPETKATGPVAEMLVATSRQTARAPELFSNERDYSVHFANFQIAIPPNRKAGEVKFPKGKPDPENDFLVTSHQILDGERSFIRALNTATHNDPSRSDVGTLFVHGYNSNFAEGLYRASQLSHDLRPPGPEVFFSWPSEAKLTAYLTDRESALFARDDLAQTIRAMSKSNLKEFKVVGHSMGTFVVMDTLRTMALANEKGALRKIGAIVLISADIEIDVFRRQAPPLLAAGIPIFLIVSSDDKALRFSARLRGQKTRLGSISSVDDLGGLDVNVIDLSAIDSEDSTGHFKVGTSPEVISMIQALRAQGLSAISAREKPGPIVASVGLLRMGTDKIMSPLLTP